MSIFYRCQAKIVLIFGSVGFVGSKSDMARVRCQGDAGGQPDTSIIAVTF